MLKLISRVGNKINENYVGIFQDKKMWISVKPLLLTL